jgi:transcriptional regulator with XRE-family HTH domain
MLNRQIKSLKDQVGSSGVSIGVGGARSQVKGSEGHGRIVTQRDILSNTLGNMGDGGFTVKREPSRPMDPHLLGARIANARKSLNLTQERLAAHLGYSSTSRLGNYESGNRIPSLADLTDIAKALGYTLDVLVEGDEILGEERAPTIRGDIPGHIQIDRLAGFDKHTGPNELYLPEFLVRQRVPHANLKNVRWIRNPTTVMRPRIQPGALVLVDVSHNDLDQVMDGETYAVRLYGRPDIRRIQLMPGDESIRLVGERETENRFELARADYSKLEIGGLVIDCL